MVKKTKLKTSSFDFDSSMDFNDFGIDDIDADINPELKKRKSRSPVMDVFKGTIKGAGQTVTDPNFVKGVVKKSMPSSYGTIFDAADGVVTTGAALYDEAVKELKPQLSKIAKKVDRLIPEESKGLKRITGKISGMFGDEAKLSYSSKQAQEDQGIATALGQIFRKQQESSLDSEARENAEGRVRDHIEGKRFTSNLGVLSSINESVQRLSNYTENVTQAYQKKSLELQFRSLFVQTELLGVTNRYYEVFKNQNEAIAKNTALPEFVKINNSERFKDIARTKFMDNIQTSLFGKESKFGKMLARMKVDGSNYIKGAKAGLETGMMGIDGVEQMQEANKMMADMGMEGVSTSEMAGMMAGSSLGGYAGDKFSKYVKPHLEKNKKLTNFGYKASSKITNLSGSIDTLRKSDKMKNAKEAGGMKGFFANIFDGLLDYGADQSPDMKIDNAAGIKQNMLGSVFDGRTQKGIVDVIPGYLSRILREVTILRTGDESTEMVIYDQTKGTFISKKDMGASIKKTLSKQVKLSSMDYNLDKSLDKNFEDAPEKSKAKLKEFMANVSRIPNMEYTPENLMNTDAYKKLDKKTQKYLKDSFDKKITNNADNKDKNQYELTRSITSVRDSTADIRGDIELFVKAGYGDILEEQGILTRTENNDWDINKEAYFKLLNDEGIVRSDKNAKRDIKSVNVEEILGEPKKSKSKLIPKRKTASKLGKVKGKPRYDSKLVKSDITTKENINPFSPNKALDAIKNTKIYKWFYKQGEGDQVEHTGPMAQDVNKTMGEEAAPGGVQLDLTTMNGNNMAAIQALSDKQDKMTKGENSTSVLRMIQKDTASIFELLKSKGMGTGSGGSGDSSYTNIAGTMFGQTGVLAGKLAGDAVDLGKQAFDKTSKVATAGVKSLKAAAPGMIKAGKGTVKGILTVLEKATGSLNGGEQNKHFTRKKIEYLTAEDLMKIRDLKIGLESKDMVGKMCKMFFDRYPHLKDVDTSEEAIEKARNNPNAGDSSNPGAYEERSMLQQMGNIAGNITSGVSKGLVDIFSVKIPMVAGFLKNMVKTAKKTAVMLFAKAQDVYVKGSTSPVIKAYLLRAGHYRDQATGEIVRTMGDLKKLKGNVVDKAGNVILTIEDAAKGLVDSRGVAIKTGLEKLGKYLVDQGIDGFKNGKAFAKGALKIGSGLVKKGADFLSKLPMPGFIGFGGGKIYDVLVEIRDILNGKSSKTKDSDKAEEPKEQDSTDNFVDPVMPAAVKAKRKATKLLDKAKSKFLPKFLKTKEQVKDTVENTVKPEVRKASKKVEKVLRKAKPRIKQGIKTVKNKVAEVKLDPKYKSSSNIIDTMTDKATSLWSKFKNRDKDSNESKDDFVGPVMPKGVKAKRGVKGLLSSAGSKLSKGLSMFKSKKEKEPEEEEVKQTEVEEQKKEVVKVKGKREGSGKKRKGLVAQRGPKAFNDKDGDGKREGNADDEIERKKKFFESKKNKVSQADLKAQYRSKENIIDTMINKASGIFDMASKGLGGVFGGAGDMMSTASDMIGLGGKGGILGKLGSLGKGALNFVKSPIKGTVGALRGLGGLIKGGGGLLARALPMAGMIGKAALAVGSTVVSGAGAVLGAVGSGLAAIGSVLASPVVLGAIAVAAVGYGAYKAYKYFTRDTVDEFEDIRMKQYGIGTGESDKKFNHYVLALEGYLLDDKIGYDSGKAYILEKKLDQKELIEMFSIDAEDKEMCQKFAAWYSGRFKPFFLTNITGLFAVNKKVKLNKLKDLTTEEKLKYLSLISFDGGPYGKEISPFKDLEKLNTDKAFTLNAIKILTDKLMKDSKKSGKATPPVVPKPDAAKSATQGTKPAINSSVKEQTPVALPKTNEAPKANKDLSLELGGGGEGDGAVKEKPNDTVDPSFTGMAGKMKLAEGPLKDGAGADQFLKVQPGVKFDTTNPSVLKNFRAMVEEYGETTGKKVQVNSGSRTTAEQAALYQRDPKTAAKPGRSLHEFGLALDVNSTDANAMEEAGLMRKYGFTRPVGGEPWHVEPAGIQTNIQLAKKDSEFATQAVDASLFKGGGGAGTIDGIQKGKRDQALAMSLLDQDAQVVKATDKDKAIQLALKPKSEPSAVDKSSSSKTTVASKVPSKPANDGTYSNVSDIKSSSKQESKVMTASTISQSEKYSKIDSLPDVEKNPSKGTIADTSKVVNPTNKKEVGQVVEDISKQQGTEPKKMVAYAAIESGLNPNAKASTSSASGLFQFTKATWNEQISKNARKYNLDPNVSPTDVTASTLMATEYVKSNERILKSVKSDISLTDVYLAHFLGPTGAKKFLKADPSEIAANILPDAAKANKAIFYENGRPLTISEVYNKLDAKLVKTAKDYGISLPSSKGIGSPSKEKPTVSPSIAGTSQATSSLSVVKNDTKSTVTETASSTASSNRSEQSLTTSSRTTSSRAPDADTVSNQSYTNTPKKGSLLSSNNSIISSNDIANKDNRMQIGSEVLSTVSNTLIEQLTVQKEIREGILQLSKNLSPEALDKFIKSALSKTQEVRSPEANQMPAQGKSTVNSAIDLSRKIA